MERILEALKALEEDPSVPKNIKNKVNITIKFLTEQGENKIKINRALHELEEVTEDANVEPYTRTQLLNVVSLLESI